MPYDPTLDKAIWKETRTLGEDQLTVGVFSYNGGEKKLQIQRQAKTPQDEWGFAKLGRLTRQELDAILPLLQTALSHM